MTWNQVFVGALLVSAVHVATAQAPVTLSGPTPAIESTYSIGTQSVVVYTVTNYAPSAFPITVSGLSSPVSRVASTSNDCSAGLPAGSLAHPGTCNVSIEISPTNIDSRATISQNLSVNYQARDPLTSAINFSVNSSPFVMVAVGQNWTGDAPALLVQSISNGASWATKAIQGDFPATGTFKASSCSGAGTSAKCIAVGQEGIHNTPLLAQTLNGGNTWSTQSVADLPTETTGRFKASTCTTDGTVCLAVGSSTLGSSTSPLVARQLNGGSWSTIDTSNLGLQGELTTCSCSGTGSSAQCIAAGGTEINPENSLPILIQSTNGGNSWTNPSLTPLVGTYYSSSCSTSVCVAVGFSGGNTMDYTSFVEQYNMASSSWSAASLGALASDAFVSVSCTGADSNTLCDAFAVRITDSGDTLNFDTVAAQTSGTSGNWVGLSLPTLPDNNLILSVSCTGSGEDARCAAGGGSQITTELMARPLILQKSGSTGAWTLSSLDTTVEGTLVSTSCAGSGADTTCFAAGDLSLVGNAGLKAMQSTKLIFSLNDLLHRYCAIHSLKDSDASVRKNGATSNSNEAPFIVQNTNGDGTAWSLASITGNPTIGLLSGTAATTSPTTP